MARERHETKQLERTRLLVPLARAQERVFTQIERGEAVPNQSINENEEARRWYEFTSELLRQISSSDELRDEFQGKGSFETDISTASYLKTLRSIHERLELLPTPESVTTSAPPRGGEQTEKSNSRRVFVVHGHDDGLKETVARFLTKLDLEPIILHEQPNRGRTIIEKFEAHADVAFAVVLFTPDDMGYPAGKVGESKPRARQNVVLELGFFMGALGRERVCALYTSGVDVPSDYSGVLYEELDSKGAWRLRLALEIKSAGIEVDLNRTV
jgi:predicted nucleotide-binding protein